MEEDKPVYYL